MHCKTVGLEQTLQPPFVVAAVVPVHHVVHAPQRLERWDGEDGSSSGFQEVLEASQRRDVVLAGVAGGRFGRACHEAAEEQRAEDRSHCIANHATWVP